ncbi:hypothetical protein Scep_021654 [Stephania cephalantha]|uniref:Uncharacterized protein n=1 Tax=Stephania cephalantha TaxID=152367 RepID=A0AAP0F6E9_9MAGN
MFCVCALYCVDLVSVCLHHTLPHYNMGDVKLLVDVWDLVIHHPSPNLNQREDELDDIQLLSKHLLNQYQGEKFNATVEHHRGQLPPQRELESVGVVGGCTGGTFGA